MAKDEKAKEAPAPPKTNSRGEPVLRAAPKRLRWLQSTYGEIKGAKAFEEEQKAGKVLYPKGPVSKVA
jgi:hypothetical protein